MSTENDKPVYMPDGNDNILIVSGKSTYKARQSLASCLLSTLTDIPDSPSDCNQAQCWTVAYIVAIAKALIDSMEFERDGSES